MRLLSVLISNSSMDCFSICRVLNSTDDLSDWLDSAYSYLAMVDYPYPADFMMPLPGHPIREVYLGSNTL